MASDEQKSNLNPISTSGILSPVHFIATLAVLVALSVVIGEIISHFLAPARASGNLNLALRLYGVWTFLSSVVFLMVTSAFIKLWAGLVRFKSGSIWPRRLLRISLLSPVLSVFTVLVTFGFAVSPLLKGLSRLKLLLVLLSLFVFFHTGFMGVRLWRGEVTKFQALTRNGEEWFDVHVVPYLNPATKYVRLLVRDYQRISGEKDLSIADSSRPFTSPLIAVLRETMAIASSQNQQREAGDDLSGLLRQNADDPLDEALSKMERMVSALEVPAARADKRMPAYLEPIGLLRFFSSPEIPLLQLGEDAQRVILLQRLAPLIESQIQTLEAQLPPVQLEVTSPRLSSMRARLAALKANPLAL